MYSTYDTINNYNCTQISHQKLKNFKLKLGNLIKINYPKNSGHNTLKHRKFQHTNVAMRIFINNADSFFSKIFVNVLQEQISSVELVGTVSQSATAPKGLSQVIERVITNFRLAIHICSQT